jgi:hypothetical protein
MIYLPLAMLLGSLLSLSHRTHLTSSLAEPKPLRITPAMQSQTKDSIWLFRFKTSDEAIRMLSHFNTGTHKHWIHGKNEHLASASSTAIQVIKDSVLSRKLSPVEKKAVQEAITIIGKIRSFGDSPAHYFIMQFPGSTKYGPGGGALLIINGACSRDIYSSTKLTKEQRALKVLTTKLLPGIKQLGSTFNVSSKYLAFTFTFGSKRDKNANLEDVQSEFLCAVFLTEDLKKYNTGELPQTALISKGDYYFKDNSNYRPPIKIAL